MIIRSSSLDVYWNLAAEEYLLTADVPRPTLFLWRSDKAIVLGKNQVPWKECRVAELDEMGVSLARRISGGGAVFHDAGNLNCSLFMPRTDFRREILYALLMKTVSDFGIESEIMEDGRSIGVTGIKFSGHAFCYRRNTVLHHATMLVEADTELLEDLLKPCEGSFTSHSVASVPADVADLCAFDAGLITQDISDSLSSHFSDFFGGQDQRDAEDLDRDVVADLREQTASWERVYGATPRFDWSITLDASGIVPVRLDLHVEKGRITEARMNAPDQGLIEHLTGLPLQTPDSAAVLRALVDSEPPVGDWAKRLVAAGI